MHVPTAVSGVLSSPVSVIDTVNRPWKGIIVIAAALGIGFSGGVGFVSFLQEQKTHTPRIEALEQWRVAHEDSVSAPRLDRIARLEAGVDTIFRSITSIELMVNRLFCDRWPEECEAVPPEEE